MVERTDLSRESTFAAMKKLLELKSPPNAIITFNDYVHMDAVQYALQEGVQVNKNIVFVSYANLPITSYTAYPPLVSLEQFPFGQGHKAMEIMIKILSEKSADDSLPTPYITEEMAAKLVTHS
jgi:DNA-binding LacI/PurR family transcriptional regulator